MIGKTIFHDKNHSRLGEARPPDRPPPCLPAGELAGRPKQPLDG